MLGNETIDLSPANSSLKLSCRLNVYPGEREPGKGSVRGTDCSSDSQVFDNHMNHCTIGETRHRPSLISFVALPRGNTSTPQPQPQPQLATTWLIQNHFSRILCRCCCHSNQSRLINQNNSHTMSNNSGEKSHQSIGAAAMFGAFAAPSIDAEAEQPQMRYVANSSFTA